MKEIESIVMEYGGVIVFIDENHDYIYEEDLTEEIALQIYNKLLDPPDDSNHAWPWVIYKKRAMEVIRHLLPDELYFMNS